LVLQKQDIPGLKTFLPSKRAHKHR